MVHLKNCTHMEHRFCDWVLSGNSPVLNSSLICWDSLVSMESCWLMTKGEFSIPVPAPIRRDPRHLHKGLSYHRALCVITENKLCGGKYMGKV